MENKIEKKTNKSVKRAKFDKEEKLKWNPFKMIANHLCADFEFKPVKKSKKKKK